MVSYTFRPVSFYANGYCLVDECRYNHLLTTLKSTFPSTADAFHASLAAELVARLREFYIRLRSLEVPHTLNECHRSVPPALEVLSVLHHLKFDAEASTSKNLSLNEIDGIKCRRPQQKAKHAKSQTPVKLVTNTTAFTAIGKDVPQTEQEASKLAAQILRQQENVMEVHLSYPLGEQSWSNPTV